MVTPKRTQDLELIYTPHEYQECFLQDAINSIHNQPDVWHLYSSPTGTGKSVMQLMLQIKEPGGLLVTPRLEIINGMLDKVGYNTSDLTLDQTVELAGHHGIYTPIRLRNLLAKGLLPFEPRYLQVDECHHDLSDTHQLITMYLNGIAKIGLTATPFRGTPKGTRNFLIQWNDTVKTVLTVRQAIEFGYCALPSTCVWGLFDDDELDIQAGEFKSKQADEKLNDVMGELVKRSSVFYMRTAGKWSKWDRPTMFSVPSVDSARSLKNAFDLENVRTEVITGSTSYGERQRIFRETVALNVALIQVNVVSEGVDLPIRRLIDCAPTLSPVRWMQQIGRIMRPTNTPPEYYTICRNLERHGYLMEGMLPSTAIRDAQQAFDSVKPSSRGSTLRVLGTENLKKFKATPVKLLNGITVYTYALNYQTQYKRSEYFVIVHPNDPELVCGIKESNINEETHEISWGKWRACKELPPTDGFTSVKLKDGLTEKQQDWWNKSAAAKGLDPAQPLTNRVFQTLPFLTNIGGRL